MLGQSDQLKLRHVVVLEPGTTSLSLYSEIDRLFCLTFPRRAHKQARTSRDRLFRRSGTLIFLFDARTMTVAADWIWILFRELGGRVPRQMFVQIPDLSVRVRVPVPEMPTYGTLALHLDRDQALARPMTDMRILQYSQATHAEVIQGVVRMVQKMPNWARLAARMRAQGLRPQLAWRSGSVYHWVRDDVTLDGFPRLWSVLVGSLFTSHKQLPTLEMLANLHYPTDVVHPSGARLEEPPAVEGTLWRLRAVSGLMTRIYGTTQGSLLFLTRETRAFPPDAYDGLPLDAAVPEDELVTSFLARDHVRQELQIRYADGFVDLCDVRGIRSVGLDTTLATDLSGRTVSKGERFAQSAAPLAEFRNVYTLYDYDGTRARLDTLVPVVEDAGGDAGLQADDKSSVRALRQVDLLLENGRHVRLEMASAALAREWMLSLFQLAVYWRCRRKMDVSMLSMVAQHRPAPARSFQKDNRHVDEYASYALRLLWNWCMMDGCRPIRYSGCLFSRAGRRHSFANTYFVICGGTLIPFKLVSSVRSAAARQNEGVLFRRDTPIDLRDAYVYTGRTSDRWAGGATNQRPSARQRARTKETMSNVPRLFSDGLTSYDADEDCTFILRARTGADTLSANQAAYRFRWKTSVHSADFLPGLADKVYNELLFRARTVVERDLWVRALGLEIEALVRSEPERETRVRERGEIV